MTGRLSNMRTAAAVATRILLTAAVLLSGTTAGLAGSPESPTPLTLYTTLQRENLRPFKQAFEADNPDIQLRFLFLNGNGEIIDRLLSLGPDPEADAIWGLSAGGAIQLKRAGLLRPYRPLGWDRVSPRFRDQDPEPAWVGTGVWTGAACVNAAAGLPIPRTWTDLADPTYRGQVAMPSPQHTGNGLALVTGWIRSMGEEAAWSFMDALDRNVALYTAVSGKPCRMAATGAVGVGLSFDFRALMTKAQSPDLSVIFPDGTGWDISTVSILAASDTPEAAQRFVDWSVGERARDLMRTTLGFSMVGTGEVTPDIPGLPGDLADRLATMDFTWLADNRDRILAEWNRRYGARVEQRAP